MSMSALGAAPAAGWLSVGREAASACELVSGGAVCGVTVEPSSSADFSRQTHTSRLSSIPQDAGLEYVLKSRRVAGVEEAIKMEQPSATTCSNSVPPTSCTWMPLLGGAAPVLATSLGMVAAAHSSADSMACLQDCEIGGYLNRRRWTRQVNTVSIQPNSERAEKPRSSSTVPASRWKKRCLRSQEDP